MLSRMKKDERKFPNERGKHLDWMVGSVVVVVFFFFFNFNGPADMEVGMMLRMLRWRNGVAIWAQKMEPA